MREVLVEALEYELGLLPEDLADDNFVLGGWIDEWNESSLAFAIEDAFGIDLGVTVEETLRDKTLTIGRLLASVEALLKEANRG